MMARWNSQGYSSTPWTVTQDASSITWSTETFAQNQNANAIRFGTLYNFRFDADQPPNPTNATVGFFKTGSPMPVLVQAPGGAAHRPPRRQPPPLRPQRHGYANGDSYCNGDSDCYCYCYRYSHGNSYTNSHNASTLSHANSNSNGYSYTYSAADPYPTQQSGSASASDAAAEAPIAVIRSSYQLGDG